MAKKEESQEYKERCDLIKRDLECTTAKHNMKMEQLAYERETNRKFHEWALERDRIKRAEERKLMQERDFYRRKR